MTKADAVTTQKLHVNLGSGMKALVAGHPVPYETDIALTAYATEVALGKQIDALIGTVVKAVLEGRQTNAQIRAKQQAARQAFARALARKVAKLR